ncbi:MAG: hypothetical protein ACYDC1_25590 [Limisphaerales bacterium]
MKQIDTGQSKETEQWLDHLVGTVGDITDNAEEDQLGTPHPEDDPTSTAVAAPGDQVSKNGTTTNQTNEDRLAGAIPDTGAEEQIAESLLPADRNNSAKGVTPETEKGKKALTGGEAITGNAVSAVKPVVIITPDPFLKGRRGSSGSNMKVRSEKAATVPASNGNGWQVALLHTDSKTSKKLGLAVGRMLKAQGLREMERGDLLTIEVGVADERFRLTGRASRRNAAYFSKDDAKKAKLVQHEPFNVTIVSIDRATE